MNFTKMSYNDIKCFITELDIEDQVTYIDILSNDKRKTIKNLSLSIRKNYDKFLKEEERLYKMMEFERNANKLGYNFIAGIDEAGRGPLAGPVVAAAVILPRDAKIKYINDSKQLSLKKREEIFDIIYDKAIDIGVGIVDNNIIDEINILNATKLAMKKAINLLKMQPEFLLIDALTLDDIKIPQKGLIKGDSKSMSIAAASIIAKVTRDRILDALHCKYPSYSFNKHKGYGTKEHYNAINKYGITNIHRKSFLKSIIGD